MHRILLLRSGESSLSSTQLGIQLESKGYCVDHSVAKDILMWLQEVKTVRPDLILMEVQPETPTAHYRYCKALREDEEMEDVPVVLLGQSEASAQKDADKKIVIDSHPEYLLKGLEQGANDYLNTPFQLPELVGKIKSALRVTQVLSKARDLATQLNLVNEDLYQRNIQVEKELYVTRQLQQSLLPAQCVTFEETDDSAPMFTKIHFQNERVRVSGIYLPCDALGGDLYDVFSFGDTLGISITDVSGHGVPAGFITAIFKTSLYRLTHLYQEPAEVMYHLNNELSDIIKTGDYVTSIYQTLNLDTMTLKSSGAGHPYPVYIKANSDVSRLEKNGTPLVWMKNLDYPQDELQLSPGDKVFLYTDGVSELKNPANEMFGEARIPEAFLEAMAEGNPWLMDHLIGKLSDFTEGAPLEDDISMVLIEAL